MTRALVAAILLAAGVVRADGYGAPTGYGDPAPYGAPTGYGDPPGGAYGSPPPRPELDQGRDGTGLVPGYRFGLVKGAYDGTAAGKGKSSWGTTHEFHVDYLKTFGGDRRAVGISLSYLMQSSGNEFDRAGLCATAFLSTVLSGPWSVSLRAGRALGGTHTVLGNIDSGLWRAGGELTRVYLFSFGTVGVHLAGEYYTGSASGRSFTAAALVLGGTFGLAF